MVMETPSPQCVGREFVRQYYTLLNEVPLHLHRFYSHNSSFVHGGVEKPGEEQPPVVGQAEIHKKIMSLNFRDCHAKIRQVDSQATVGNAVVVQVTGELSNNGQPMRRFMQTFVLAPQSPKKYYVHNDIFRYQDEVFHDDSDIENQEEDSDVENMASNPNAQESMQEPGVQTFYEQQTPLSNGTSHLEDRVDSPSQKSAEEEKEEVLEPEQVYEEKEMIDEDVPVEQEPEAQEEEPQSTGEPKPFSWAALASKNTSSGQISQQSSMPSPPQQKTSGGPGFRQDQAAGPQPQRSQRSRERRDRDRLSASRDDGEVDVQNNRRLGGGVGGGGGGPPSRFPDSHQLFVGNLPQNVQESELRKFFEKYGNVVEVRINTKSVPGKLPNFGFVVFDSPGPVGDILRVRPLLINGDHRLNVEEKKPKEGRPVSGRGGGPPRGMMGRGAMGNSGRGGGMRGGMGARSDRGSMGGRGGMGPRR